MRQWLYLGAAITAEVAASLALKAALAAPWWYALVISGYVVAFGFLTICLRGGMTISVAYSVWGAGGVTATALLSAGIFGEELTWLMALGMATIVAGVIVVERGSHDAAQKEIPKEAA
jgi:small multidrug resistance pump